MYDQYFPHLKQIEDKKESMIQLLMKWGAIHSGSDNLPGLKSMLEELKSAFSALKSNSSFSPSPSIITEIPVPPRKILQIDGTYTEQQLGNILSVTQRPEAPLHVLLVGHMDLALKANQPLEPWKQVNDKYLVGRGTADMKAGLLIMLTALQALETSPFAPKIGWTVLINADEEIGSPGSRFLMLEKKRKEKIALIFEPSLSNGNIVNARKGSANFTIAIKGKSAHAGRSFHEGINAITSAARFALAAESLTDLSQDLTVNIGYLHGGGAVNIVPDTSILQLNVRVKTQADLDKVKQKINEIANIERYRDKNIQVVIHQDSERPPKIFDKRTRQIFDQLKQSAKHLGMTIDSEPSGGVCDGNLLASTGLITIDTLGAVGGALHTAEEYILINSLVERSQLVARFLMQLAAREIMIT